LRSHAGGSVAARIKEGRQGGSKVNKGGEKLQGRRDPGFTQQGKLLQKAVRGEEPAPRPRERPQKKNDRRKQGGTDKKEIGSQEEEKKDGKKRKEHTKGSSNPPGHKKKFGKKNGGRRDHNKANWGVTERGRKRTGRRNIGLLHFARALLIKPEMLNNKKEKEGEKKRIWL